MAEKSVPLPRKGQKIYVPSSLYLSHGCDDFMGGIATVIGVEEGISGGEPMHYVTIKERPSTRYNWEGFLSPKQKEWKREYGKQKARKDPDMRPEFNELDAAIYN
ncbi:MAG: hypothetical protein Q8O83_03230 [bacterium]|nr:hypothetical protein [bacterium]